MIVFDHISQNQMLNSILLPQVVGKSEISTNSQIDHLKAITSQISFDI